jgi:hypothetical protein
MITILPISDGADSDNDTHIGIHLTENANSLRKIFGAFIHSEFFLLEQGGRTLLTIINNLTSLSQTIHVVGSQCKENGLERV